MAEAVFCVHLQAGLLAAGIAGVEIAADKQGENLRYELLQMANTLSIMRKTCEAEGQ
jgi:hypothetical protein